VDLPWQCDQCGASGVVALTDDDLDSSEAVQARVTAAHAAHPLAHACPAIPPVH
jgi:hypothetical protein